MIYIILLFVIIGYFIVGFISAIWMIRNKGIDSSNTMELGIIVVCGYFVGIVISALIFIDILGTIANLINETLKSKDGSQKGKTMTFEDVVVHEYKKQLEIAGELTHEDDHPSMVHELAREWTIDEISNRVGNQIDTLI